MIDFITSPFIPYQVPLSQTQQQNSSQFFGVKVQNKQEISQNKDRICIYIKTKTKKSVKLLVDSVVSMVNIRNQIKQKLQININQQILFLNGRIILQENTLQLYEKSIIHVLNKQQQVSQNQKIKISLKVKYEKRPIQQTFCYQFLSSDKVQQLFSVVESQIQQAYDIPAFYQPNFLYSSLLLDTSLTFKQNKLGRQSQIICIFSQNQMTTRSDSHISQIKSHQSSSISASRKQSQASSNNSNQTNKNEVQQKSDICEKQEQSQTTSKVKENIKVRSNAYLQSNIISSPPSSTPRLRKKSQTLYDSTPSKPNFKKKKYFDEDGMTDQSTLLKRIKVSKSKKEIQQIIELSLSSKKILFNQNQDQKRQEQKSQVSQSSEDQNQNQKQKFTLYKPSPLIPKSMPSQQRNLIRQQIQKLFSSDSSNGQNNKKQVTKQKRQEVSKIKQQPKQEKEVQARSFLGLKLDFTPKGERKPVNKNLRSTLGSNFDLAKLRLKKGRYDDQSKQTQ